VLLDVHRRNQFRKTFFQPVIRNRLLKSPEFFREMKSLLYDRHLEHAEDFVHAREKTREKLVSVFQQSLPVVKLKHSLL
jgi:hypothetical protein